VARRAWTREAADYLREHIRPGDTVFASFGDQTGIFREAGIPVSATRGANAAHALGRMQGTRAAGSRS